MRLVINIAVLPSYGNRSIAITIDLPEHCLDDPTVDPTVFSEPQQNAQCIIE